MLSQEPCAGDRTLAMMSRFGCSTLSRSFLEEHANRFKAFGELFAVVIDADVGAVVGGRDMMPVAIEQGLAIELSHDLFVAAVESQSGPDAMPVFGAPQGEQLAAIAIVLAVDDQPGIGRLSRSYPGCDGDLICVRPQAGIGHDLGGLVLPIETERLAVAAGDIAE